MSKMPAMSHSRKNVGRTMRSCAAAALLLCASASTLAQTPATEPRPAITVSGTVRDSAGNPVADASVFLEEKATSASVGAKTAADGAFSFLALHAGTYIVRAQKEGMRQAVSGPS